MTNLHRLLAATLALLLLAPTIVLAEEPYLETTGYGLIEFDLGPDGKSVTNPHLAQKTRVIPAQKGVRFGVAFNISGLDEQETKPLTFLVYHPDMVDPATGETIKFMRYDREMGNQINAMHGYSFDESWELVPGDWIFEIWTGSVMLASEVFVVYTP